MLASDDMNQLRPKPVPVKRSGPSFRVQRQSRHVTDPRRSAKRGNWWERHQRSFTPYLFLSPFAVLFSLVLMGPFVFAVWLSLYEWNGFGAFIPRGLGNYRELFASGEFRTAVWNTLILAVCILGSLIPASLLLAIALNARKLRGRMLYRSIFMAPTALSTAVVAVVFGLVFDPKYGLINAVLIRLFGGTGIDWIGQPWPARVSIMVVVFWRSLGLTMLFFLAGLQNISQDLMGAARLDGANERQVFRHVIVPGLRPITTFLFVVGCISMLQLFEEPFILTGGGPAGSTETVVQLIYRSAFVSGRFGYASSIGVVLVLTVLVAAAVISLATRLRSALERRDWGKGASLHGPKGSRR